jgi:cell fate regulator YaaT (PSP1 superfamily)
MHFYYLRLGAFSEIQIGGAEQSLNRGTSVVVRSRRGIELGEVVSPVTTLTTPPTASVRVLRVVSDQDKMLLARLQRHKRKAIEKCRKGLESRNSTATLLDIDHLFDGSSIVLHFLGHVDSEIEAYVRELASDYESIVRTGPLSKLLSEGCGEGCGTSESKGCGSSCFGCSAASLCSTAKK